MQQGSNNPVEGKVVKTSEVTTLQQPCVKLVAVSKTRLSQPCYNVYPRV